RDLEPPLVERFRYPAGADPYLDVPDLLGRRPDALRDAVLLRSGNRVVAVDARNGRVLYRADFGQQELRGPLVFSGSRVFALTRFESRHSIHVHDAATGKRLAKVPVMEQGEGRRLLEHNGQVSLLYQSGPGDGQPVVAALHSEDGTPLWRCPLPREGPGESLEDRFSCASGERLVFFTENPVRVLVVNTTSGLVENAIPVQDGKNATITHGPRLLPDGRIVLALSTSERTSRVHWEYSYEIHLVDPARRGASAVVWTYARPAQGANRVLAVMNVIGEHVVALDETRSAVVLDLRNGDPGRTPAQLRLGGGLDDRPKLSSDQPAHDALLLLTTRAVPGESSLPAHLAAFDVPELRLHYPPVPLASSVSELVNVLESQGVLGVTVTPGDRQRAQGRILLLDPLTGQQLDRIDPPDDGAGWFTAAVQNGILVVITGGNVAYGYGPK
ncbi:MAG: PQQ-binding-like beta-propeller repeat protein, partial [Planctomycetota bacterium]